MYCESKCLFQERNIMPPPLPPGFEPGPHGLLNKGHRAFRSAVLTSSILKTTDSPIPYDVRSYTE